MDQAALGGTASNSRAAAVPRYYQRCSVAFSTRRVSVSGTSARSQAKVVLWSTRRGAYSTRRTLTVLETVWTSNVLPSIRLTASPATVTKVLSFFWIVAPGFSRCPAAVLAMTAVILPVALAPRCAGIRRSTRPVRQSWAWHSTWVCAWRESAGGRMAVSTAGWRFGHPSSRPTGSSLPSDREPSPKPKTVRMRSPLTTTVLQALVLADHVYVDRLTGKKVIAGTFNRLWSVVFPAEYSSPTYAYICLTDIKKSALVRLRYVEADDNKILMELPGVEVTAKSPLDSVELIVEVPPLPMPHEGTYHFEVYADDKLLGSVRILVAKPPQEKVK